MCSYATLMKVKNKILSATKENQGLLFDVYNDYAEKHNQPKIYDLDPHLLASAFEGRSQKAFENATNHSHFSHEDSYWFLDDFGRVVSFQSFDDFKSPLKYDPLAEWLAEADRFMQYDFFLEQ